MKNHHIKIIFSFILFVFPLVVIAQPPGGPPRGRERIEQFRKLKLIEVLDLKEDDAIRFFAKFNEHEKIMQDLQKRRADLVDTLEVLLKQKTADKVYENIFDDMYDVEAKLLTHRKAFRAELKSLLTAEQMAKLHIFQRRFGERVRETMDDMRREKGQRHREERD
ncbi:MAG: hypothetical protein KGZ58_01915 [Ignavibacteriales bacterium]|nr:hypothetical protein [Ignavibacteriales bacterium]